MIWFFFYFPLDVYFYLFWVNGCLFAFIGDIFDINTYLEKYGSRQALGQNWQYPRIQAKPKTLIEL